MKVAFYFLLWFVILGYETLINCVRIDVTFSTDSKIIFYNNEIYLKQEKVANLSNNSVEAILELKKSSLQNLVDFKENDMIDQFKSLNETNYRSFCADFFLSLCITDLLTFLFSVGSIFRIYFWSNSWIYVN